MACRTRPSRKPSSATCLTGGSFFLTSLHSTNFTLGNASGEGGAPLVPFSPFSILFSLPLLSSPSHSFHSLFLPFFFFSTSHSPIFLFLLFFHICFSLFLTNSFHPFFSSSPLFHLVFVSSFLPEVFFFFFLRELLVLCASNM